MTLTMDQGYRMDDKTDNKLVVFLMSLVGGMVALFPWFLKSVAGIIFKSADKKIELDAGREGAETKLKNADADVRASAALLATQNSGLISQLWEKVGSLEARCNRTEKDVERWQQRSHWLATRMNTNLSRNNLLYSIAHSLLVTGGKSESEIIQLIGATPNDDPIVMMADGRMMLKKSDGTLYEPELLP